MAKAMKAMGFARGRKHKEVSMFSNLGFRMKNSLGIPVTVGITYKEGLVSYVISFGDEDVTECKIKTMSKGKSDRFVRKWRDASCNDLLKELPGSGEPLVYGDSWCLELRYEDKTIRVAGSDTDCILSSLVQPVIELLDDTFGVTRFVKSTRVDGLEIEMFEPIGVPEGCPPSSSLLGSRGQEEHLEMDRDSWTLAYSRRVPAGCFHNSYECYCENEIRQILDQISAIFGDDSMPGSRIDGDGPLLTFTFHFHDGSSAVVDRVLSRNGTGVPAFDEMLEAIGHTIGGTVFGGGMFDFGNDAD